MPQSTLLTPELDNALEWHNKFNQNNNLAKYGWKSAYNLGRVFSLRTWGPLKFPEKDVCLALVEAAAKNDLARISRILKMPFIKSDAIYCALVAAVQNGQSNAIEIFLNLPNIEMIISEGIHHSQTTSAMEQSFIPINRRNPQALAELSPWLSEHWQCSFDHSLFALRTPNLIIEAACCDRLPVLQRLRKFDSINTLLHEKPGYYACLRAAEQGHLSVLNEFLEIKEVQEKIIYEGEAIYFAAKGGHVNVVDRLLEFPLRINFRSFLTGTLQYGTAEVIERLLKVPSIDEYLRNPDNNARQKSDIEECAYHACYANTQKSYETACRMFKMLLKYPIVAEFAKKEENKGSGNVVWEILMRLKTTSEKPAKLAKVSSNSGELFPKQPSPKPKVDNADHPKNTP